MRSTRERFLGTHRALLLLAVALFGISIALLSPHQVAAAGDEGFSLQVSPSPLVATVKPGQDSTLDLHIRNTGSSTQNLKMGLQSFSVSEASGQVVLGKTAPAEIKDFITFANPTFSIEAGEVYTQRITIAVPASAGFSYSFAMTVAQQQPPKATAGRTAINGSVAVFTLLNVDRPGATRKLELSQLSVSRHVYEFLPATVQVKLKNSGNTLVQPRGNIYIQRHKDDTEPLSVISLNPKDGYILPGTSRSLATEWNDGFPHYKTTTDAAGATTKKLVWDMADFSKLRFGRYVAKVVAIYNDDGRDVPLTAEVSFWVIPWRILLVLLVIIGIIGVGLFTIIRSSRKVITRPKGKHDAKK